MRRRHFLLAAPALLTAPTLLAGCAAQSVWAPDEAVRAAVYRHPGPPLLSLFTMRNTSTDNGAHTGLMVSASQRVVFDPAGTFSHPQVPERNDVHFGITPRLADFYISYHARETYYVQRQEIPVSAEAAEIALQAVQVEGPVPQAACTTATTRVLRRLPGFEGLRSSFFPDNLADQIAQFPGVREDIFRETDSDDKDEALETFLAEGG